MPDMGDLVSFDYEPQQDDQEQFQSFSMPQAGWSMGYDANAGGPSGGELGIDWNSFLPQSGGIAPDASLGNQPFEQTYNNPVQAYDSGVNWKDPSTWMGGGTTTPTESTPALGGMGGSGSPIGGGGGGSQDDDWKKLLMKGGLGIGTSLAGTGLSALLSAGLTPSQPKAQTQGPMPSAPASPLPTPPGQSYQMAPFTPPPGPQWSPLLAGGPKQTQISQGLNVDERVKKGGSTGGLTIY